MLKICSFRLKSESPSSTRAGLALNGKIIDLSAWLSGTRLKRNETFGFNADMVSVIDLIKGWQELQRLFDESGAEIGRMAIERQATVLAAPIPRPPKILATIVNTPGMLGGNDINLEHPRLDMKAPSAVIGPDDEIRAPPSGIRPEVELAAVVGRETRNADEQEAARSIFGYTILNDVTAPKDTKNDAYEAYRRDTKTDKITKVLLRGPLFRSKNHDTFAPMGPWIVTKEELEHPSALRMKTEFNGRVIQEGSTSEYIFKPEEIIAFVSRFLTLEPGDLVSCGSIGWAAGELKGADPSEWILPSLDGRLDLEIEGIGVLSNPVRALSD
jgi:2-keto-4-pentenoate hydratase/2-oxohepta-3-ene-1,7-dioic acid hydratase in catechol pathway